MALTCWYTSSGPDQSVPFDTCHSMLSYLGPQPMRKEGGLILGTGGDNSRGAVGTWFEGAVAGGYVSAETEAAIQANIVAAGYTAVA